MCSSDLGRSGIAGEEQQFAHATGRRRACVPGTGELDAAGLGALDVGGRAAGEHGRGHGPAVRTAHGDGEELAADAGTVLAVAVGRSRSQVAVFDLGGTELAASAVDHEVGAGPDLVMPGVADQLARLIGTDTPPVLGIGLSLPGAVDTERGVSVDTPVMAGWDGIALAPYLASVTDAPLFLANDADILARSEYLGHVAQARDLLVLKASTGLGLGVVADGRIVTGALGAAGEIGHTKVPEAAGRPCRCGDVGCLETIAAGWALVARLREEGREVEHVRDLVAHALAGDPEAKQLLRESGRMVGELLAVAINLLNPRAVVLGGDMAAAYDVYAAGVREAVYARSSALATRELQFLPATYGDRAGLVGCAALALDEVLSPVAVDARLRNAARPSG